MDVLQGDVYDVVFLCAYFLVFFNQNIDKLFPTSA